VATFRALQVQAGLQTDRIGVKLELYPHSSFEDAHRAADQIRETWQLGDVPAEALRDAIERRMGAQVLFADAPAGLSGAAVQVPGYSTIIVNRNEPEGRRNFDLAHELFHVLTWDAMPPPRVDRLSIASTKGNRVEKLAENFAGALLMPAPTIGRLWGAREDDAELVDWLNRTATSLRVTSVALKWRLVVLGLLSKARAEEISDESLANNGGLAQGSAPLPFNRAFIGRVYHAVEEGWLSLRKACGLLGMGTEAFDDLCRAYGLQLTYEV
jgi:Zn-dependent peptidase ImmA (M78 family)